MIHELNTIEVDLDILNVICHSWKCLQRKLSDMIHELNRAEVDLDILNVICHSWKYFEQNSVT